MSYPNTILTSNIKKGINIFLILLFFIISPLIILYTAGYRYDFKTKEIKQTGVISVDVTPKESRVYLNDVLIDKKIPLRITNRAPGIYKLSIESDGYQSWTKDIAVESKQTTFIRDIMLYKKNTVPRPIFDSLDNIIDINLSYDGKYALLIKEEDGVYEIELYEVSTGRTTTIIRTAGRETPKSDWSPFSNFAHIRITEKKQTDIHLLSATNPDNLYSFSFDVSKLGEKIEWHKSVLPSVFVQDAFEIKQLGLTGEKSVTKNIFEKDWFIDDRDKVWSLNESGDELIESPDTQNGKRYQLDHGGYKIIDINENRAILSSSQDTVIVKINTQETNDKKTIKTQSFAFNTLNEQWITWSSFEIWSINKDGEIKLSNRTGEEVEVVYPLNKFDVMLLITKDYVSAFDSIHFTNHRILQDTKIRSLSVNQKNQTILFYGSYNGEENLFSFEY